MITAESTDVTDIHSSIGGEWRAASGSAYPVTNPATGAVIGNVHFANAEDVDRAAKTAHEKFKEWREVPVVDRVQPL